MERKFQNYFNYWKEKTRGTKRGEGVEAQYFQNHSTLTTTEQPLDKLYSTGQNDARYRTVVGFVNSKKYK